MCACLGMHVEVKRQLVCTGASFHHIGPDVELQLLGLAANAFAHGAIFRALFVLSMP